jgi:hypothetical protein
MPTITRFAASPEWSAGAGVATGSGVSVMTRVAGDADARSFAADSAGAQAISGPSPWRTRRSSPAVILEARDSSSRALL